MTSGDLPPAGAARGMHSMRVMRIRSRQLPTARRGRTICAVLVACALAACDRDPASGATVELAPAAIECRVDDDCTLMPAVMTCCEECDPVPPFEVVPRTAVDAVLIELETRCAAKPPICEPRSCEVPPPGCQATAICVQGRCSLVQTDACSARLVVADPAAGSDAVCATRAPADVELGAIIAAPRREAAL